MYFQTSAVGNTQRISVTGQVSRSKSKSPTDKDSVPRSSKASSPAAAAPQPGTARGPPTRPPNGGAKVPARPMKKR